MSVAVERSNAEELAEIERNLAYEHATSLIESHCLIERDDAGAVWFDLATAEIDLTDEVKYLQARRLLLLHPSHPRWVSFCDEDEPTAEVIH